MRFDTHDVRTYLIRQLMTVLQVASIKHDGSDFILLELQSGETIILYLFETSVSLAEIRKMLKRHTELGYYSLLLFWCDMLLPGDKTRYMPDDWMAALLSVYGGKLYGYEVYGNEYHLFPVYFDRIPGSYERYVHYGERVNFNHLRFDTVRTESAHLAGVWRMAEFGWVKPGYAAHGAAQEDEGRGVLESRHPMSVYYAVLEVSLGVDFETVKRAYRQLARQYHPDVNATPEATEKMQQINEAYRQLAAFFEAN